MNEVQLILQAHSLVEKKKRTQIEELQKFIIIRESVVELLGTRVNAPPMEFEYLDHKFSKTHALPFIYLTAPLIGAESLQKMMKAYGDSVASSQNEEVEEINNEYESLFQLISEGYETDEIVKEMTGKNVDELIHTKIKKQQDKEVSQLSSTRSELEDMRKLIMEESPVKKKKKPVQFNIKLED